MNFQCFSSRPVFRIWLPWTSNLSKWCEKATSGNLLPGAVYKSSAVEEKRGASSRQFASKHILSLT